MERFHIAGNMTPVSQLFATPSQAISEASDAQPFIISLANIWTDILADEHIGYHNADPAPWFSTSQFMKQKHLLDQWFFKLPSDFEFSIGNLYACLADGCGGKFTSLHLFYHLCCIRLNRIFLPIPPNETPYPNAPRLFQSEAVRKALTSATSISIIISEVLHSGYFILVWSLFCSLLC